MEFDESSPAVRAVTRANEMYERLKYELENAQYAERAAYSMLVDAATRATTRYDFFPAVLKAAVVEQHNKKKAERKNYETIKQMVTKDFLQEADAKFLEMIQCGYEMYAIQINIEYHGDRYSIEIPLKENINEANFDLAHRGKIVIMHGTNILSIIGRSYDVNDLKNVIHDHYLEVANGL